MSSTDWTTDDDYHWHAATCGHEDAEEKVKHSFDDGVVTKEANETEEGEKTYTCSICGKTKTVKTGTSDHKHTYESTVSYDETYHWYKSTCAHTTEMKDKAKHSYDGGVTVEPTCTEDGKTTYKCTECDYSYSDIITKKGHSFASTWSSDDEYHWYAATCEHSDVIVKEKHTFDSGTVKKAATCVEDGTTTYTCSICNKSVDKNIGKDENNHSGTLSYKYDSYLTKKNIEHNSARHVINLPVKKKRPKKVLSHLQDIGKVRNLSTTDMIVLRHYHLTIQIRQLFLKYI